MLAGFFRPVAFYLSRFYDLAKADFVQQEQRQSARFVRHFAVTDHEDEQFSEPFEGLDVNLTGLSFWVDDPDWFLPGQQISLRIKNLDNNEVYCLDGVEVIHLQNRDMRVLCGCHITHVSSAQLLAHHRTVVVDEQSANLIHPNSAVDEFDFDEEGTPSTENLADLQALIMVSLLQFEQLKKDVRQSKRLFKEIQTHIESFGLSDVLNLQTHSAETPSQSLEALMETLRHLEFEHDQMFTQQIAWNLFAKLLAFSPEDKAQRQVWQTMIADFEALYLSEKQQIAFDFMHQGVSARKALAMARDYVQADSAQLELDNIQS